MTLALQRPECDYCHNSGRYRRIEKGHIMDTNKMKTELTTEELLLAEYRLLSSWLPSIDKRLKSINGKLTFFVVIVVIDVIIQVLF